MTETGLKVTQLPGTNKEKYRAIDWERAGRDYRIGISIGLLARKFGIVTSSIHEPAVN